ncbi:ATP phosphoribosyltransferase [Geobacter sulfurreducens]|jgi:ATP phosphoribosyltransferase|uniref:ATP phosphoribosyltransferase 1 n=1 Tax=Geobacter sulfurreducens (strain ATCC 51573 / DSM 12127 / PCA) TaxID=243231 RepID=HIS11_GEOSL|nr:ATP phosphoribosyltransferase [Geobacter sulfurreducens]P60804.1 RecName: Full=ATP phosphoribosyltransferase 1; Short=ATP-PRT 1; Short=ATP-PRTase 1 [Geobacter sulfurreducens PCA]AAR34904.1 ATP phosphoribosyltransferase, long form [Geobacter sulfurreducens PCA]ADI84367.1 ATP phosphoribosyltransferase, long form [Geobacter sulfurreducens KN400]AJY71586.1 ATP phosphoribosyltransferase [Geobacter sulfurreducens]QVW36701.1 ATP phosphoribosyltransferase [Geobacter sulfurreducens]UAC05538.1 ATP p
MSGLLNFGVPKGSLENATVELFRKAGWQISISSRSYFPGVDDDEMNCKLIRPQEMGKYVERGTIDAGIAGRDWVRENESDVVEVCEMVYSKVSRRPARWVLVVTRDSAVQKPEDLHGATISTELVGFTKRYFAERNIPVTVEFSWGATEAKVVDGLCDAIVEVTETGSTIKANGLRIVCDLMESVPVLIANKAAWADPWKREKIETIATLLKSALAAEGMVGLKMNAPNDQLEAITRVLPSLKNPTVSHLFNSDWVSIESILPEKEVRRIVPELIKLGAEGIVEYPLNKII